MKRIKLILLTISVIIISVMNIYAGVYKGVKKMKFDNGLTAVIKKDNSVPIVSVNTSCESSGENGYIYDVFSILKLDNLNIKSNSVTLSLIRKELNTFFKIPVFIVNAGFGLVLFIIVSIVMVVKYNMIISLLPDFLSKNLINNNISLLIFILIVLKEEILIQLRHYQ